jgi:glycosyltransferase EpsD
MSKILFVANIHKHFTAFHLPYIKLLKEQGHIVHLAANGINEKIEIADNQIMIPFSRSPIDSTNFRSFKLLKQLVESEKYDLISCHTSIASLITRLACIKIRKNTNTKLLYTVHGFDFSRYSSIISWAIYYPIEKLLSRFTDGIITINSTDFELISKHRFNNKDTYIINSIGLNSKRLISNGDLDKRKIRAHYGFRDDDFILIYIARFISIKNHKFIVDSTADILKFAPEVKILFVGDGELLTKMKFYSEKKNLGNCILFLGFRDDVGELIYLSDVGISSSKTEGFGMNIAEEQFSSLPVVATQNNGHNELVQHGSNGFLFPQNDHKKFIEYLKTLYFEKELRNTMGKNASKSVKKFDISVTLTQMDEIYQKYL